MSKAPHQLKSLETQRNQAHAERKDLLTERERLSVRIRQHDSRIADLNKDIADLQRTERGLIVSEHALLRYLQHKHGVDVLEIQDKIKTIQPMADKLGNGSFPFDDCIAVVRDGVVVTIKPKS